MSLNRRDFLKTSAIGLSAYLVPGVARRASAAVGGPPVLVALYLRGAADGLSLAPPIGDADYAALRPSIAIPALEALPLDGLFGLHPALAPLHPLYVSGDLALIHASGSPDPTRSHFDAQDYMERAAPGDKSVAEGWLNRTLLVAGQGNAIEGISLKSATARALAGPAPTLAFSKIADFALTGQSRGRRRTRLEQRYAHIPGTLLGASVQDAFAALDQVAAVPTDTAVAYPEGSKLGAALADAAALIKADIGVRVITVDLGGWDHHSALLPRMAAVGGELAGALAAFHQDLGACAATTLTLCMTEFGRRVAENGTGGTDHGHGGLLLALGGGVAGGRVILAGDQWPGLTPEALWNGQDLAVTTDFRDVFAEALSRHLGLSLTEMAPVFPSLPLDAARFPGLYL